MNLAHDQVMLLHEMIWLSILVVMKDCSELYFSFHQANLDEQCLDELPTMPRAADAQLSRHNDE